MLGKKMKMYRVLIKERLILVGKIEKEILCFFKFWETKEQRKSLKKMNKKKWKC